MTTTPAPAAGGDYLTAAQIAAELGVHEQTAQRYFRSGGLPGRKIGHSWMTTRAALDKWLTEGVPSLPDSDDSATVSTSNGFDLEVKGGDGSLPGAGV